MAAFALDFVLVSILSMLLFSVLFVATFGLAAFVLPSFWPFVAFFYNGLTVSGGAWRRRACASAISRCARSTARRSRS